MQNVYRLLLISILVDASVNDSFACARKTYGPTIGFRDGAVMLVFNHADKCHEFVLGMEVE